MLCHLRNAFLISAATLSVAAAAPFVGATPPKAHQLDETYTFDQYLNHFDKSYTDPEEYVRRSQIFAKNLATILSHNKDKEMSEDGELLGGGWVMGVNMFTDIDLENSNELPLGYNKMKHSAWRSQIENGGAVVAKVARKLSDSNTDADTDTDTDTKSYSKPVDFDMDDVAKLPEGVDWAKDGKVNPTIPQQGGCGSCWSFATVGAIEAKLAILTGDAPVSLTEQNVLQCTPNPDDCGGEGKCSGSTVELAMNYIADRTATQTGGMFEIKDVPYHASTSAWGNCQDLTKGKVPVVGIEGFTNVPTNDYKATMNALAKEGPLAVAVAASKWFSYEKGVLSSEDSELDHAVLLVGYGVDEQTGEKYWKVRNSWGPGFGENGFIRIKRDDDDSTNCRMDNNPLVGLACALDDNGNKLDVKPVKVCGDQGILFDPVYAVGAHMIPTN